MKKWLAVLCTVLAVCLAVGAVLPAGLVSTANAEEEEAGAEEGFLPAVEEDEGEAAAYIVNPKGVNTIVLYSGETRQLELNTAKEIKWSSSDSKIVKVDKKGRITANQVGKTTVLAAYGSKEVKVEVRVKAALKLSDNSVSIKKGKSTSVTLTSYLIPKSFTYTIKDKSIASVSIGKWKSGSNSRTLKIKIKGKKAGSTTLKITNTKTKVSITLKIKVTGGSSSTGKYRALLIGNSNYRYGTVLPNHKYGALALQNVLTKSVKDQYQTTYKTDLTASQILSAISSTFSGATSKDVSLFFYGGHGNSGNPRGSLLGIDSAIVSPAQLRDALLKVPGKVIVLLDSCYSGSYISNDGSKETVTASEYNKAVIDAFSGYTIEADPDDEMSSKNGELRQSKFIVLTAALAYEESWNFTTLGYSAFAKALLNGLGCSWYGGVFNGNIPCDSNKDGIASLSECKKYVYTNANKLLSDYTHNPSKYFQHCMSYGDGNYPIFRMKK